MLSGGGVEAISAAIWEYQRERAAAFDSFLKSDRLPRIVPRQPGCLAIPVVTLKDALKPRHRRTIESSDLGKLAGRIQNRLAGIERTPETETAEFGGVVLLPGRGNNESCVTLTVDPASSAHEYLKLQRTAVREVVAKHVGATILDDDDGFVFGVSIAAAYDVSPTEKARFVQSLYDHLPVSIALAELVFSQHNYVILP